jgi:cellulose synthase/poly-beta-1,6-N-acetylglucosamine synthase-like glycosyltransferase
VGLSLDSYHLIDQSGKQALGCLVGFNGSGGVFRAEALRAVGGWSWDTLSEDMDMSFKLQLSGWKGRYLKDVVVDGELPPTMSAFRVQQARWSKGSIQCAIKHLTTVWGSNLSPFQKIEASLQLNSYTISLLMFMTCILAFSVSMLGYLALPETNGIGLFTSIFSSPVVSTFITIGTLCIVIYYLTPIFILGLSFRETLPSMAALFVIGYGISAICAVSLVEGLFTKGGEFLRVPKYNRGSQVQYNSPRLFAILEPTSMALCCLGIGFASVLHTVSLLTTLIMYCLGFIAVGYEGLPHVWLLNALRNMPPSNP